MDTSRPLPSLRERRLRWRAGVALVLLAALVHSPPALAAWPTDPHVNLAIRVGAPGQFGPGLVGDGQGGAYVSGLVANGAATGQPGLHHVTPTGALDPAWPPTGIVLGRSVPASTIAPILVTDGAHGVIATWVDGACMRCSRIGLTGHVVAGWPDSGLALCSGDVPTAQRLYAATADGFGGVVVAWFDAGNPTRTVAAQRVVSTGIVGIGWPANFVTLHAGSEAIQSPVMVSDTYGGAVLVWTDYFRGVGKVVGNRVLPWGAQDTEWAPNGNVICDGAGSQASPAVQPDGTDGLFVAWQDERANPGLPLDDIYLQRIYYSGQRYAGWPAGGFVLCNAAGLQTGVALASDDSGGVYAAWSDGRGVDRDIYASRCLRTAALVPGWPAQGVPVCTAAGDQGPLSLAKDWTGGAIAAWTDARNATPDQYAQRVLPRAAVDPGWTANGVAVSLATGAQTLPNAVPDGAGGAIVAWADGRNAQPGVYAQRIAGSGLLGGDVVIGVAPPPWGAAAADLRAIPNPAHGGAVDLRFRTAQAGDVRLSLYDVRGRFVRTVADAAYGEGEHVVHWDGRDAAGRPVAPGVYLARLHASAARELTRRVVILPAGN